MSPFQSDHACNPRRVRMALRGQRLARSRKQGLARCCVRVWIPDLEPMRPSNVRGSARQRTELREIPDVTMRGAVALAKVTCRACMTLQLRAGQRMAKKA